MVKITRLGKLKGEVKAPSPVIRPNYNPALALRSDWRYIGCLTERELFNGSSVARSIAMPHNETWLESHGLSEASVADEYCYLIDCYLAGKGAPNFLDYETVKGRIERLGKIRR